MFCVKSTAPMVRPQWSMLPGLLVLVLALMVGPVHQALAQSQLPPTNVNARLSDGSIALSWTPDEGATSHTITGSPNIQPVTLTTGSAHAFSGLTNGVTTLNIVANSLRGRSVPVTIVATPKRIIQLVGNKNAPWSVTTNWNPQRRASTGVLTTIGQLCPYNTFCHPFINCDCVESHPGLITAKELAEAHKAYLLEPVYASIHA